MKKRLLRMISLVCCVGTLLATTAVATEEQPPVVPPVAAGEGTITVLRMVDDVPVKDSDVSIYRVADVTDGVPFWTDEFSCQGYCVSTSTVSCGYTTGSP